ncbi:MAG TPA: DUF1810 domain-containing protein [Rhizomicrobium sp.]|nr:DUF1810 domain-containing protein [Rhizomicrobium sp.]
MSDPFDLERFIAAQDPVYARVIAELRRGSKQSHWMWFVFPQVAGLGHSPSAAHFAIASLAEAKAYLAHPLLGGRLKECTGLVLEVEGRSALQIFGDPDNLKFRSSMTLFAQAAPGEPVFRAALDRYFSGDSDTLTLSHLNR